MEVKFVTEPSVHLLGAPVFSEHPLYKLPTVREQDDLDPGAPEGEVLEGTASEQLIAHAGKGCYDAYGKDGRSISQHISSLISSGHGSVLEHANVSIFVAGISRGCSHEFVRHRAGFDTRSAARGMWTRVNATLYSNRTWQTCMRVGKNLRRVVLVALAWS